ncbi:TPR repeat containing exported protein [Vibrio ishigakensis]|uniref:Cell division coordinator CpoB n=1 Tax=Vibrio ishigakensis TaxID=1481914 RepID=A0A0B8P5L0_9VIBR|nr:tol-pal system protein YbgF [Vibrio ishigakensis]GAM58239.1 TPR repeat containing exported protein [Vibrio ishigakensis]GAM70877.1 TPR repeat containing exported protein [Vibrio sp. JCM 19236]
MSLSNKAVALTLLASVAGFASAAPAPVSDLDSPTTQTTASTTATTSSSASRNETDVQRLERLLRNSNRVQANLQQQVDDMSIELSEMRGELERNQHEMRQLVERQRELFIELDKVRTEAAKATVAPVPTDTKSTSGKYSANQSEQQAYQSSVDLILKNKDYDAATVSFEKFLKDYPESVYASNAHYWLGQLYFSKKKDVESAKSFASVVSFKDSNKRADALVKLGDIAVRNNNAKAAKKYYQQAIDEYPNTSSAQSAQSKIGKL